MLFIDGTDEDCAAKFNPFRDHVIVLDFFYNLTAVDRGCPPLLASHQLCPYLISTQLATALPKPAIPCYLFYSLVVTYFLLHAKLPDLLASDAGLDIGVEFN